MATQLIRQDDDFERAYFARRAVQETELAQRAGHPAAVAAHYRLATTYLELAYADVTGPEPDGDRGHKASGDPAAVADVRSAAGGRRASDRRRTS